MFLFYTSTTNKISIERGPRGEWGPGSARARKKLQFGALDAGARADPVPYPREAPKINFASRPGPLSP